MMDKHVSKFHWLSEDFRERMTAKQWSKMLLERQDTVSFEGKVRRLKAKKLGFGVVEIYKEPLAT